MRLLSSLFFLLPVAWQAAAGLAADALQPFRRMYEPGSGMPRWRRINI